MILLRYQKRPAIVAGLASVVFRNEIALAGCARGVRTRREAHKEKPAGMPAGREGRRPCAASESDAHLALDGIRVALEVGHSDAMAPAIFGTEVDKRHRAPEQVGVGYRQLLVVGGARSEDVRVERIPDPADLQGRPQAVGPPMLVPDPAAI